VNRIMPFFCVFLLLIACKNHDMISSHDVIDSVEKNQSQSELDILKAKKKQLSYSLIRSGRKHIEDFFNPNHIDYFDTELKAQVTESNIDAIMEGYCKGKKDQEMSKCVTSEIVKKVFLPLDQKLRNLVENHQIRAIINSQFIDESLMSAFKGFTVTAVLVTSIYTGVMFGATLATASTLIGALTMYATGIGTLTATTILGGPIGWVLGGTVLAGTIVAHRMHRKKREESIEKYYSDLFVEINNQKPVIITAWEDAVSKVLN